MGQKYVFKQRPYKHQVQAIKKLVSTGFGGALLMEPRTGKTKVAIDYMGVMHLGHGVNRVLIIGPVVAIEVWKQQLKDNMPLPYRLTIWDRKGRKNEALPSFGKDILDIVIMNYDAFSTPGELRVHTRGPDKGKPVIDKKSGVQMRSRTKGGRYAMKKAIQRWAPHMIILDESHRIKSPSAKKSTAIHSLGPIADYRVILTGTVITKSKRLFDAYSQWKFLNPERFGGMNFAEFKNHFGRWLPMDKYSKFLGSRNEGELHELMHMDSFSITREECYDLPKSTTQIIPVQLEESAKLYDQMAEDMVARIQTGEITEASIKLVQALRLQQITSGFTKTSPTPTHPQGRLVVVGDEKLRAIEERLEDLMEADEKVVIGALFKSDIARLIEVGKRLKVPTFAIHGAVKQADRARIPGQFKAASGGAIFIGQPAAAGEAIDLSAASILQWYSLPPSWVQFRQFSDRIALSDKPTFHEFYLAAGTVDFLRYETLMEDGDIGKKMIQSPERLLRLGQSFSD
jgi:SNF2 family DNA or RNA helicase